MKATSASRLSSASRIHPDRCLALAPAGSGGCARKSGFTLLEIIIALALVAILMASSLPYLMDSFANSSADRSAEAISSRVLEVRRQAMQQGVRQEMKINPQGVDGVSLPEGWGLQIKGLNDARFRAPGRDETWTFDSAGICEPLQLRLSDGNRELMLVFDALTGQVLHDHE